MTPGVYISENDKSGRPGIVKVGSGASINVGGGPPPPPPIVSSGLTLYWDASNLASYPGSGSTVYDLSGNNAYGTISRVTFDSTNGGGWVFANEPDPRAEAYTIGLAPGDWLGGSDPTTTISFWSKTALTGSLLGSNGATGGLMFAYGNSGAMYVNKSMFANAGVFSTSDYTWTPNTIANHVLTKSGNTYKLYVNGVYKSQFTSALTYNVGALALGVEYNPYGFFVYENRFVGTIYSFMIHTRALSDAEVLQNFNAQKTRFGL